jgi:glycosyltransferase involved in cell wall biosynthesis
MPITEAPLVSVITMVLNGVTYLEPCIQSVLTQSYRHVEHVIVDGASTDGSVEVILRYACEYPGRIRFISEPDKGSGDAWNKGLRMAQGEIFGWVGADDLYEPDAVESIVKFFHSNPDAYFVYGGLKDIDEQGKIIRTCMPKAFHLHELINERCVIPTPAAFYRRKVIERVGGFDDLGNDLDFFIRVGKVFPIHRIEKVLSSFRIHAGSQNTGSNINLRLMWKREDCLVSRRHGGGFFSGYCLRYYNLLLIERLRPILGPFYPLFKKVLK